MRKEILKRLASYFKVIYGNTSEELSSRYSAEVAQDLNVAALALSPALGKNNSFAQQIVMIAGVLEALEETEDVKSWDKLLEQKPKLFLK